MSEGPPAAVTAVVLCGGGSTRLGVDKTRQAFGEGTVLDQVLGGLPAAWAVVGVGPSRACARAVVWTREDPPGGGPLAAIAAGLRGVETPVVVVVAGDMPFVGAGLLRLVDALEADESLDAAAATSDATSAVRANPLVVAYRTAAARRALDALSAASPAGMANGRARALLDAVPHAVVCVPADTLADVDTAADLAAARARLGELRATRPPDGRGPDGSAGR